jgi:hypothetical protein
VRKDTLGGRLNDLGWECGSVIPEPLYEKMGAFPFEERISLKPEAHDWLITISQTCDLVAPELRHEPHVEILWCRAIEKPRTQFRDLRSTRRLDFRPDRGNHPNVVLSAHAAEDRYVLPRSMLDGCKPRADRRLANTSIRRLQAWMALRYARPAWPESFVERVKAAKDGLVQALEAIETDDIAEVRIALSPHDAELDARRAYKVAVFFIVDEEIWESDPERRRAIYGAFSAFVASLKGCPGIVIDETVSGVRSGVDFTWQQVQATEPWNFANLTYRE